MITIQFEGQPLTKREILIAREAYANGWDDVHDIGCKRASELYPLPKVTRPRVLQRGGMLYRVNGEGRLESKLPCRVLSGNSYSNVEAWGECQMIPASFAVPLADLLANPTEEVEE